MGQLEDESRVGDVYAAYITPIPFIFFSTVLRIYTKTRNDGFRGLTLDDYIITFATISAIGELASGLRYGPPYGFGRHIATLSLYDVQHFFKGDYIFSHFYNITLGSVKLGILVFYYRIFVVRVFQRVVLATIIFIVLWILTITIVLALECRPIARFWDASVSGTCFNLVAFTYFTNISNLATDLWIFFLPIPIVVRLQTTTRRKISLCCVFLVGLATCAISATRLKYVIAQGSTDFTWDGVPLGALSASEALGGILCANLPIIYKLLASPIQRWKNSIYSSRKHSDTTSPGVQTSDKRLLRERKGSVAPVLYPESVAKASVSNVDVDQDHSFLWTPEDTLHVRKEFPSEDSRSYV